MINVPEIKVAAAAYDEQALKGILARFNLAVHTLAGNTYAFYKKRSGDNFSYALDLSSRNLDLVNVYAVPQKSLQTEIGNMLYKARSSGDSRYNGPPYVDFIKNVYKKNEKRIDTILIDSLNNSFRDTLMDKNLYTQALGDLYSGTAKQASIKKIRTAGPNNPWGSINLSSDDLYNIIFTGNQDAIGKYVDKFVENLLTSDIMPSIMQDLQSQAERTLTANNFANVDAVTIAKNMGDKLVKFVDENTALFLTAVKEGENINFTSGNAQENSQGQTNPKAFIKLVTKYAAESSGTGIQPSGSSTGTTGNQSSAGGSTSTDSEDTNSASFDKEQIQRGMAEACIQYLTTTYPYKNLKATGNKVYPVFNEFVKDTALMFNVQGVNADSASAMATNVKNAIVNGVQGGFSKIIPKDALEDHLNFDTGGNSMVKFLKDGLIPYEQANPHEGNVFNGLKGNVQGIDVVNGHYAIITSSSTDTGTPPDILRSKATIKNALEIYQQKYT